MNTDKKEIDRFSKEDVNYVKVTPNFEYKCEKCQHRRKGKELCDLLKDQDNEINPSGICDRFEPGKHLIIDQSVEEKTRNNKLQCWYNECRRKKILRMRKIYNN